MTAWIIVGCIVLFFVLLFTIPAYVTILFREDLALTVRVFGIPIRILPKKPKSYNLKKYTLKKIRKRDLKEEKKRLKKEAADAEKAKKKAVKKKQAAEEKAKMTKAEKAAKKAERPKITELVPLIGRVTKLFFSRFFGKLHIRIMTLHIKVAADNAAATAIQYGIVHQSAALLLAGLKKICPVHDLKKADISITPDYTVSQSSVDVHMEFRMSLGNILGAVFKAAFAFLGGWFRIKSNPRTPAVPFASSIPVPPVPPCPWKRRKKADKTDEPRSSEPPSETSSTSHIEN
jgi:hypothetical protein